jgi:hypothetical protein
METLMPASASHSISLALSPSEAWEKLSDLTLAPHYVPGLTGCQLHPGPRLGLGASRRVLRKYGQWLDETVIDWQDGVGFVLRLHCGEAGAPFPFRTATFRYALLSDSSGTRLSTRMDYRLRGGRLVERLLAKAFAKVVRQVTENLKAYYETGVTQNHDFAG